MSEQYILEVKDLTKRFPGVLALDKVSFEVRPGEIVALVGENGAGKSTLMKTLIGVHKREAGIVRLNGKEVSFAGPLDAKDEGLVLIFQELSLVDDLSVMENIFIGKLPMKGRRVDWNTMYNKTTDALKRLGCNFSAKEIVKNLSISEKQMVEIARALVFDAKVVFFDEPTSSIMQHEKEMLFQNIRMLKEQGLGIVYITHKLDEVFELTERVIVFRDGKRVGTVDPKQSSLKEITELMIGRSINEYFRKNKAIPGNEILRVEGLSSKGSFEDVSFSVRAGEVVGFYGLVGAGRTELMETIFGVRKRSSGKVFFESKEVTTLNSKHCTEIGMSLVPEDRKGYGCVLGMSCLHNISLVRLPKIRKGLFINRKSEIDIYNNYKNRFAIKSPSPYQLIGNLSGGNQQKIILGKWMAMNPKLLILDEPTRGIDVGTKSEIHNLVAELAESGLAVIVISSEMPEIIGVSNRVCVMRHGRLVGEINEADGITESALISRVVV